MFSERFCTRHVKKIVDRKNDLKISSNMPAIYLETQTRSDHGVGAAGFLMCFFPTAFAHK